MPSPKRVITVAETPAETTIKETLAVQSIYDSRLKYIGAISGKAYEWSGAGVVVDVLSEDVPYLLGLRIGERACCGARQGGNQVFQLANRS